MSSFSHQVLSYFFVLKWDCSPPGLCLVANISEMIIFQSSLDVIISEMAVLQSPEGYSGQECGGVVVALFLTGCSLCFTHVSQKASSALNQVPCYLPCCHLNRHHPGCGDFLSPSCQLSFQLRVVEGIGLSLPCLCLY